MGMENISHVDTGFGGWKKDRLDVQSYEDWQADQ